MQSVARQGDAAAADAASVASQRSLAAWAVDATPMRPKDLSQHEWNVIILQMKNFNAMHWSLLQQRGGAVAVLKVLGKVEASNAALLATPVANSP